MHHHLHIGAGILLLVLLAIVVIIGFVLLAASSKRKARLVARQAELIHQERMAVIQTGGIAERSTPGSFRGSVPATGGWAGRSPLSSFAGSSPSPTAPSTVYVDRGGSSDLVTGMLLGEMATGGLGGRETIVENTYVEPSRDTPAPSDSGSGFWGARFDSGSGSSSDGGSGFDVSW